MVGRPRPAGDKKISIRHCVPFLKDFNSKKRELTDYYNNYNVLCSYYVPGTVLFMHYLKRGKKKTHKVNTMISKLQMRKIRPAEFETYKGIQLVTDHELKNS